MGAGFSLDSANDMRVDTIIGANDTPYHLTHWQPATLYPVHSTHDLWLLVYGSYTHPMAIFYTQLSNAITRGVQLEGWRVYGKRPVKPMRKFRTYDDAMQLEMFYGKSSGLDFASYISRTRIVPHSGADLVPPPAEGSSLLEGVITHDVTRAFAQRWAKGGYVYPASEDPVTLNVPRCVLWSTMTYNERALYLTHREHSLLAAYYAIPHLNRKPKPIDYADDAPGQTFDPNTRAVTLLEPAT